MARGRRSDRTGSAGRAAPAGGSGVPENAETVEFEELPDGPVSAQSHEPAASTGAAGETERTISMAQTDDPREPEADVVVNATEPDPVTATTPARRGGGFWTGLLGGLLGGAAVAGAGGWYVYEHGPLKPALGRLETVEASSRDAENGIAALGGKIDQVGASVGMVGNDLDAVRTTLQQADGSIATLQERIAAAEKANADLVTKVDQADSTFRAASEQVIGRLEVVNAKLVEVEQAQPADVVDKKTVGDIAAKQSGIEQAQQTIAAGLARLEQLVAHSLEAGNQQAQALRVVVDSTRSRLDEVVAEQRDLLALKDRIAQQEQADQQQLAALAETGNQVTTVRSDLEQRLSDVATKLTALDAARERGVGLSLAAHSLETALQTGEPFQPTVEIMTQLGQDDPAITEVLAKVEPMAATGIPTFAALAKQLGSVEQSLAPASTAEPDDWLARTRDNLENLVNLHPVDAEDVPGQSAVRGAVQAMLLQDLRGAVAALKPLADQGNEPAKAWVASAEQRLEATAAVDALRQHVKTMLVRQG